MRKSVEITVNFTLAYINLLSQLSGSEKACSSEKDKAVVTVTFVHYS